MPHSPATWKWRVDAASHEWIAYSNKNAAQIEQAWTDGSTEVGLEVDGASYRIHLQQGTFSKFPKHEQENVITGHRVELRRCTHRFRAVAQDVEIMSDVVTQMMGLTEVQQGLAVSADASELVDWVLEKMQASDSTPSYVTLKAEALDVFSERAWNDKKSIIIDMLHQHNDAQSPPKIFSSEECAGAFGDGGGSVDGTVAAKDKNADNYPATVEDYTYDYDPTQMNDAEIKIFASTPGRVAKYVAPEIRLGEQAESALGLAELMGVEDEQYTLLGGKEKSIMYEFNTFGKAEDKENLKHILEGTYRKEWGRSEAKSVKIEALLATDAAKTAHLKYHHILALRLYTTSSFSCVNEPLREDPIPNPHPFAATTLFIQEGIKKLRVIDAKMAKTSAANVTKIFWRGMHGRSLPAAFMKEGGAELACMSTTADFQIAVKFAEGDRRQRVGAGDNPMIFKYVTETSLVRGADISFLSVYPEEKEVLYPPLTYLQPISMSTLTIKGMEVAIIEVKPQLA